MCRWTSSGKSGSCGRGTHRSWRRSSRNSASADSQSRPAGPAKVQEVAVAVGVTTARPGRTQGDMFAGTGDDASPDEFPFGANAEAAIDGWTADYKLVNEPTVWKDFLKQLKAQERFAID